MSRSRRAAAAAVAIAVALVVSAPMGGCASDPTRGYSTQATFTDDVATVAVPIFQNDTFHRGLERQLTDALVKEIEARTPYKVSSEARADTVLLGRIREVRLDVLSKSRLTGLSEEVIVGVSIDFEWKDLRSDAVLVRNESFESGGLFVPSNPTGEAIQVGEHAVVQQLARDIVASMRSRW